MHSWVHNKQELLKVNSVDFKAAIFNYFSRRDRFSFTLFICFHNWGRTIVQKQKGTIHQRVLPNTIGDQRRLSASLSVFFTEWERHLIVMWEMFLPSWHVLRFPACRTSFCWLLLNREAENSEAASVTRAPCGSPDTKSNEDSRRCWRRRRRRQRPVQSLSITHDASDCLRFIWRWIVSLLKQLRWNLVCSFSHSVRSDPECYCVNIHRFWLKYVAKIKWGAAFTIIYSAYRRINGID